MLELCAQKFQTAAVAIMYFVPIEHRNNVIAAVADNNGKLRCHFTMEGSQCWTVR